MGGENAQPGPAGTIERQGLPDSWVMRALSSAGKDKECPTTCFPTLLKYFKLKKNYIYIKKSTLLL